MLIRELISKNLDRFSPQHRLSLQYVLVRAYVLQVTRGRGTRASPGLEPALARTCLRAWSEMCAGALGWCCGCYSPEPAFLLPHWFHRVTDGPRLN